MCEHDIKDTNLVEVFIGLYYALINLGKDIKRFIFKNIKRFFFIFKTPKYKIGDKVIMYNHTHKIKSFYKDWDYCLIFYELNKGLLTSSEGLIDYYNEDE